MKALQCCYATRNTRAFNLVYTRQPTKQMGVESKHYLGLENCY